MYRFLFLLIFSSLCGVQIQLGKEILSVEIAATPEARAKGLMGRKELAEGQGMLFVYSTPQKLSFWMKNTYIPLSIAFFDKDKTLLQLADMEPAPYALSPPVYSSQEPALYALEVPLGWFVKHQIGLGTKFSFLDRPNRVK